MTAATLFAAWKYALQETGDNTQITTTQFYNLYNKQFRSFLELPIFYARNNQLLLQSFYPLPKLTISLTGGTYEYSFSHVDKLTTAYTSDSGVTRTSGVTYIPDTDADFIDTLHVAPGDFLIYDSEEYVICQVSSTGLWVLDATPTIPAEAISYNLRTNPMHVLQVRTRGDSSSTLWRTLSRTSNPLNQLDNNTILRGRKIEEYSLNGRKIIVNPANGSSELEVTYLPHTADISAGTETLTNPTNLSDNVNFALADYLGAKHFTYRPEPDMALVKMLMGECIGKLTDSLNAGETAL